LVKRKISASSINTIIFINIIFSNFLLVCTFYAILNITENPANYMSILFALAYIGFLGYLGWNTKNNNI
jgi:hypothetical protein